MGIRNGLIGLVLGVGALVGGTGARGDAIMGTYFEDDFLKADGSTVYRAWVFADNRGLNGDVTDAADYRVNLPSFLTSVDYGKPNPDRDFFEGNPMFFENFSPMGSTSNRVVDLGYGASNKIGDLQWYEVTVNTNSPVGLNELSLDPYWTSLINPSAVDQPYVIQNSPFNIYKPGSEDVNLDGVVNAFDIDKIYSEFSDPTTWVPSDLTLDGKTNQSDVDEVLQKMNVVYGDANLDGSVDLFDFNMWLGGGSLGWANGNFNGDNSIDLADFNTWLNGSAPVASSLRLVPEPGTLVGVLGLGGLMAGRRMRRKDKLEDRMYGE